VPPSDDGFFPDNSDAGDGNADLPDSVPETYLSTSTSGLEFGWSILFFDRAVARGFARAWFGDLLPDIISTNRLGFNCISG
jgi:hypothetical protein